MPTPEQERDRERLRRVIEREGLTSSMNNTRWKNVISAVESVSDYRARFRIRLVSDHQDPDHWDSDFPWHLPKFVFIEWLELDPIVRTHRGQLVDDLLIDFGDQLAGELRAANERFSIESTGIRIWGYLRPGESPFP